MVVDFISLDRASVRVLRSCAACPHDRRAPETTVLTRRGAYERKDSGVVVLMPKCIAITLWTPEMDAAIKSSFEAGLSARVIAERLGVTRDAVLGRKFRLGLCKPKGPRKPKPDGIRALGHAARACSFTVAILEDIRRDMESDGEL